MPTSSTDRIIAGAMSGTSADGVDVALTRIAARGTSMTAQLLHHHHHPYDAATRNEIFAFRGGDSAAIKDSLQSLFEKRLQSPLRARVES